MIQFSSWLSIVLQKAFRIFRGWRPKSITAAVVRGWWSGERSVPQILHAATKVRTTGHDRWLVLAIPLPKSRSSASHQLLTAQTAPAACSPAIARETGYTRPSIVRASQTSPPAHTAGMDSS
jgi:hypothetical protein